MNPRIFLLSLVMLGFAACSSFPTTPMINGKPIVLQIRIEDNINRDMDANQVQRYTQLTGWMANDLIKLLDDAGYRANLIARKSDYQYKEGTFLLEVKIEQYNFRAAGTFLATSYDLTGEKQILYGQHSARTIRNWRHVVKKLNKDMVEAINKKFAALNQN